MNDTSARAPLGPRDVDEVVSEIKALTNQVAAVTARFSRVRRMVSKPPLDPEDKFLQHHKQFIDLIWKSRQIAGAAHVAASDFRGDIFDMILDNTIQDADKKVELEGVMESWKGTGASSSQLFQGFENLCRALDDFSDTLRQRQEVTRDREAPLEADIDGIADRLSALSVRSAALKENGLLGMTSLAVSTLVSLMCTAACRSFGLSMVLIKSSLTLSPRTAIDAISKTSGDGFAELLRVRNMLFAAEDRSGNSERQQLQATLIARRTDLDGVRRTVSQFLEALEEVSALKSDVVSLSSQLSSLCDIFNILTRESLTLLDLMDSGAPISSRGAELRAIRTMLLPIDQVLDAFAKAERA